MSIVSEKIVSELDRIVSWARVAGPARTRLVVVAGLLAITLSGGALARALGVGAGPGSGSPGGVSAAGPDGAVRVGVQIDRANVLRGGDGLVKLELALEGVGQQTTIAPWRVPTDLVVVLDRSGSMQGEPLAHAQAAVRKLLDSLDEHDRFALVTYSSSTQTVIPLAPATNGAREVWKSLVAGIWAEGGTNMSSGLDLGIGELAAARRPGRAARMVLVSDGLANEGDFTRDGLLARAGRARAGEYVLSTVGVGSSFDESLMTALADAGTGNYYYVSRGDDLGDVFAGEFASARAELASALSVEVEPIGGVEVVSAAGYPLELANGRTTFHPGSLFAGQTRRIWITLRVPTEADANAHALGAITVRYTREGARRAVRLDTLPSVAVVAQEADYLAGLSSDVWAASVAEDDLGELKQAVSSALQRNEPEVAAEQLRAFREEKAALNRAVASPAVARLLDTVAVMEESVSGVLAPAAAPARNELSKKYSAEAQDERRPGAKYDANRSK